jgi:hypothetical protein
MNAKKLVKAAVSTFHEEVKEFVGKRTVFALLEFTKTDVLCHHFLNLEGDHSNLYQPIYTVGLDNPVAKGQCDLITPFIWSTLYLKNLESADKLFMLFQQHTPIVLQPSSDRTSAVPLDLAALVSEIRQNRKEVLQAFESRLPAKPYDPFQL